MNWIDKRETNADVGEGFKPSPTKARRTNAELCKFGFNLSLGLNILGCIMFYRHKGHFIWFSGIGSIALILSLLCPVVLAPLKKALDKLIFLISWLTCVISLLIAFYLIFTPLALILKIFGSVLLNQKIDKKAGTYWVKRKDTPFSKELYEKMG